MAAVLLAAGWLATASAAGKTPNVFPPQSHPRSLSYGEWQVRWSQWQLGSTAGLDAAFDETGANCLAGLQPKRVWFSTLVTHPDLAFSGPVSLSVDGVAVPNLRSFRTQTPLFQYTLPPDNLYGLPAGTTATAAIADGMFVMLKPLHPGVHTVAVHIESEALGGVTDEIYNLTITK